MTAKAWGSRKLLVASTPLQAHENIHKLYEESKQITWEVACPHCGTYQYLDFANLKWEPKPDQDMSDIQFADMLKGQVLKTWYECPHCKGHIKNEEKTSFINNGRIVNNGNSHLSDLSTVMHLNGLYSLEHWHKLAGNFIESKDDPEKLKEFRQQALCSPWEASAKINKLLFNDFEKSEYPKGVFPPNTYKMVCGIDVQDTIMYQVKLAYTSDKKIHLYDWGIEKYDLYNPFDPESWVYKLMEDPILDMAIMDCGDGGNTKTLLDLASNLSKCQAIRGYSSRTYVNQYLVKKQHDQLLFVPIQESNSLLEFAITSKTILIPSNVSEKDEIFTHIGNVIKKNGLYQDRVKGSQNHTDYRDALRYALSWIYFCDYGSEVDKETYYKENKAKIEAQQAENLAKLASAFGGDMW
jgi:hypothetical protein